MEGIAGGRAEYAGILADRGFLPASYPGEMRRGGQALEAHRSKGSPDEYSGKCVALTIRHCGCISSWGPRHPANTSLNVMLL